MTRQSSKQRGVTLVEVMLTLAISSLLIITVLAGRNSIRSTAQFSDGMERIKEQILLSKSNANTGRNTLGNGNSSGYLLLGESIRFNTDEKTTMKTANVMCKTVGTTTDVRCGDTLTTSAASGKSITTPWKIQYTGYTTATGSGNPTLGKLTLFFVRDDQTGGFSGYWYPGEPRLGSSDLRATLLANDSEITLHFKSSDGREAVVIVNPSTGSVTRKIL